MATGTVAKTYTNRKGDERVQILTSLDSADELLRLLRQLNEEDWPECKKLAEALTKAL